MQLAGAASAPVGNNGLSFVGVSFDNGEKIARVIIDTGTDGLSASNADGTAGVDVVAMDDFIHGEALSMFRILEDGFEQERRRSGRRGAGHGESAAPSG